MQTEELDEEQLEACNTTKSDEESCEQDEAEQPLIKANNYQFCWGLKELCLQEIWNKKPYTHRK